MNILFITLILFGIAPYLSFQYEYCPEPTTRFLGGDSSYGGSGQYGSLGVPSTSNIPSARRDYAYWRDNSTNTFYLFGGGIADSDSLNDMWKYDPSDSTWTWISGPLSVNDAGKYDSPGANPPARSRPCFWADDINNEFYLFGGGQALTSGFHSDLWKFSPSSQEWTFLGGNNVTDSMGNRGSLGVYSTANSPPKRARCAGITSSSTGQVYIFGGSYISASTIYLWSDVWSFKLGSSEWAWIKGDSLENNELPNFGVKNTPAASNTPGSREDMVSIVDPINDKILLFGGFGYDPDPLFFELYATWSDLWEYDPSTNQFTWIAGSNDGDASPIQGTPGQFSTTHRPLGRAGSTGYYNHKLHTFSVFSGQVLDYDSSNEFFVGDFWTYDISLKSFAYLTGSDARDIPSIHPQIDVPSRSGTLGSRAFGGVWWDSSQQGNSWYYFGGGPDGVYRYNDFWSISGQLPETNPPIETLPSSVSISVGTKEKSRGKISDLFPDLDSTLAITLSVIQQPPKGHLKFVSKPDGTIHYEFTDSNSPGEYQGKISLSNGCTSQEVLAKITVIETFSNDMYAILGAAAFAVGVSSLIAFRYHRIMKRNQVEDRKISYDTISLTLSSALTSQNPLGSRNSSSVPIRASSTGKLVNLLSLDGGGIKGLVIVDILSEIQTRTRVHPSKLFHLIAGTSTGGLLAIGLTSKFSLLECKDLYISLGKSVFSKRQGVYTRLIKQILGRPFYNEQSLIKILQAIFGVQAPLYSNSELSDPEMPNSKQFPYLVAISTLSSVNPPQEFLFRTYTYPSSSTPFYLGSHPEDGWTLWEAARATSAAPIFFSEYQRSGNLYSDGALFHNNPSRVVLKESQILWKGCSLGLLLSIGTGTLPMTSEIGSKKSSLGWIRTLATIATNSERYHREIASELPTDIYYRFSTPFHKFVALDDISEMEYINSCTKDYLGNPEIQSRLDQLHLRLHIVMPVLSPALSLSRVPKPKNADSIKFDNISTRDYSPSIISDRAPYAGRSPRSVPSRARAQTDYRSSESDSIVSGTGSSSSPTLQPLDPRNMPRRATAVERPKPTQRPDQRSASISTKRRGRGGRGRGRGVRGPARGRARPSKPRPPGPQSVRKPSTVTRRGSVSTRGRARGRPRGRNRGKNRAGRS